MASIQLTDRTIIADFQKPYVIAEVNSSHNGSTQIARQMIDAAVEAGCDCVKFQSWSTQSLYSNTYYKQNPIAKRFVDKLSLTPAELKEMAGYCKERGIGFSSTPYARDEVDFLVEECGPSFIKISSMEVNNPEYLRYIAEKQLPIILSTGMADYEEVRQAVEIIESTGNQSIAILHCVTIYPTPASNANLYNILALREMFHQYPIGFSDHTLGDAVAVAAVTLGAAVLEKHITLDAKKIGMDNQMAMEPEALKEYVCKSKAVPEALGTKERILWPEEQKQRESMRRSVVVTKALRAGDVLTEDILDVKRPGTGIEPAKIPQIAGRTVNKDIESDAILMESDLNIIS